LCLKFFKKKLNKAAFKAAFGYEIVVMPGVFGLLGHAPHQDVEHGPPPLAQLCRVII
jgi:hypothetical protein